MKNAPPFLHPWPDPETMAGLVKTYKALTGRDIGKGWKLLRAAYRAHGSDTAAFMAELHALAPTYINLLADLRFNLPRLAANDEVAPMPKSAAPTRPDVFDPDAWLTPAAQREWGNDRKLDTINCPPNLYREHASSHRRVGEGWVCDRCQGVA